MKRSLRILVSMAVLAISAVSLQPAARAQAGFYLRFGGRGTGVAVGIPPYPGPGYFWVNGYYDGPAWIPGYWAWRGDDDGGYYGFRGGDNGGGYYGYRGGDDGGYWRRGGDGRDGRYGGFRGDGGYGRDGGRFYGRNRGDERH